MHFHLFFDKQSGDFSFLEKSFASSSEFRIFPGVKERIDSRIGKQCEQWEKIQYRFYLVWKSTESQRQENVDKRWCNGYQITYDDDWNLLGQTGVLVICICWCLSWSDVFLILTNSSPNQEITGNKSNSGRHKEDWSTNNVKWLIEDCRYGANQA